MSRLNTILNNIGAVVITTCISMSVLASTDVPVVVAFPPGGTADRIWRTVEPYVQQELDSIHLITDYRLGAGGVIGANSVITEKPAVILLGSAHAIAPTVNPSAVKYSLGDFTVLEFFGNLPMVLMTPNGTSGDLKAFTSACRAKPLSFASGGIGSATHLFGMLVTTELGCRPTVHIPYKGAPPALIDLIAGRIDFMVDFLLNAHVQVTAGKLQAVAIVGSSKGSNLLPEVKSMIAPMTDIENWHLFAINKSAPADITDQLKKAFIKARLNPELRVKLEKLGINDLSASRNDSWLANQPLIYRRFITDNNLLN